VPEDARIPSYGFATVHLIVRASDIVEEGKSITIPILADLTIPSRSVIQPSPTKSEIIPAMTSLVPVPQSVANQGFVRSSSITVHIMTFSDKLNDFMIKFFNPLTSIITTSITILGGIMGYILGRRQS
jgi:hypothetical protein